MSLLAYLGFLAICLMPCAYVLGQLSGVRLMTRHHGQPRPTFIEATGLVRAARRGDRAHTER
ncbi:MAG: hypothetical protein HOV83_35790 [Catenulispora sp.]|nr:hypothetical protein [Catenulispora sp.]